MPIRTAAVVMVLSCMCHLAPAQSQPVDDTTGVNGTRLAIVAGSAAAGITAIHLYQQNAWWKEHRTSFHFREDLVYACNIDKVGHLYGAQLITFLFSKSLQWANLSEASSLIWGASAATLFQTYVEIEDGFSEYWGFDRVDFAADVAGAWYPVLQHYVPAMKNVQLRFSYAPKDAGGPSAIAGQTKTIIDDYEGQTFWLTVTPHTWLPEGKRWWPSFLGIAVGLAVRNNVSPDRYLAWYIAPELDFRYIIPRDTEFLRIVGEALNFLHLPMPAVRLGPGSMVWYGLYF
jgi:hypothetical protein